MPVPTSGVRMDKAENVLWLLKSMFDEADIDKSGSLVNGFIGHHAA